MTESDCQDLHYDKCDIHGNINISTMTTTYIQYWFKQIIHAEDIITTGVRL